MCQVLGVGEEPWDLGVLLCTCQKQPLLVILGPGRKKLIAGRFWEVELGAYPNSQTNHLFIFILVLFRDIDGLEIFDVWFRIFRVFEVFDVFDVFGFASDVFGFKARKVFDIFNFR